MENKSPSIENRLANENSPYLLQHAHNPVDWYPWCDEALEKARQEDKPIFVSIGYAACHWCHVMAHESFEDPYTAGIMNQFFVNIKVDREERPDIDSIYMQAVVAITGQGGWPMSVFLTPDGIPFFGGTYFPSNRQYQMPSFKEILLGIARLWRDDRQQLLQSSEEIISHLHRSNKKPVIGTLGPTLSEQAALRLIQAYDWQYGGWGGAPKFPQPMAIGFLLLRASGGDRLALETAIHALISMARGGMYDVIGGGFSRYSTDEVWLIPHFEKMLYDNAQLARVYLHSYLITGDKYFHQVCVETLDFIIREMFDPAGGFYSSLDADSEGVEGKYYFWGYDELRQALETAQFSEQLTDRSDDWISLFFDAYGVTSSGNFEGHTVLQRQMDDLALAEKYHLTIEQVRDLLSEIHRYLLELRSRRARPDTDDKVLTSWNGLALIAFAEAARYLDRSDYLEIARRNAAFLMTQTYKCGKLYRSWRNGKTRYDAYLEDYAALILGLLALYQTDADIQWYRFAVELAKQMIDHFSDGANGFFDTRDDATPLVIRPQDIQDSATPSGSSLAAIGLIELAAYLGEGEWLSRIEELVGSIRSMIIRYPLGYGNWLHAIYLLNNPITEVAVLLNSEKVSSRSSSELVSALWSTFRPGVIAAISHYPPPAGSPPLLENRPLIDNQSTAYVCHKFFCKQPVTDPEALKDLLSG